MEPASLRSRTREVLRLLAAGLSTSEISRHFGYSERQGRRMVHDVIAETHSRTAAEAVYKATVAGILDEPIQSADR